MPEIVQSGLKIVIMGGGTLDRQELCDALRCLGLKPTDEEVGQMLHTDPESGDTTGVFSFAWFVNIINGAPGLASSHARNSPILSKK